MDWNRWESSFDPMFWMTPEERHESVQQEEQESGMISNEKYAVEALFNMFQSGPVIVLLVTLLLPLLLLSVLLSNLWLVLPFLLLLLFH